MPLSELLSIGTRPDQRLQPERVHAIRNAAICAGIFAACFWISWPVAQMGFIDDWSYIKSAQVFAQTGHIVYNGWAAMILGWQIPWGALFIRLFGFSFMAVKLSTFPLAAASVFLFYLIQIRFGINARNAIIGTLTLGLSPLFLPLSASFMSDVPGLFVILLCLYLCQRAVAARTNAATIAWLTLAAASNVAGGTVRQICWLGALVMVPSTAWFLRKRRGVIPAALLLWVGTVAGVLYFMHWFAMQPYSVPEPIFVAAPFGVARGIFTTAFTMLGEFLCLLAVILPLLSGWLPQFRRLRRGRLLASALIVAGFGVFEWLTNWLLPWIPNQIGQMFSTMRSGVMGFEPAHFILAPLARILISLPIMAALSVFVLTSVRRLRNPVHFSDNDSRHRTSWLLVPFTLAYCLLLLPISYRGRAVLHGEVFDRYLLGLLPVAIIYLILCYQRWVKPNLPAISVVILGVYTLLSIAGTHDWFAWQRARLVAVHELRGAGVPRSEIQAGFDYDGWTQVEDGGHVNNGKIRVPPSAYSPLPYAMQFVNGCTLHVNPLMSAVHPNYVVSTEVPACLLSTRFGDVSYHTWLPPFRRTVYLKRIPEVAKAGYSPLVTAKRPEVRQSTEPQ